MPGPRRIDPADIVRLRSAGVRPTDIAQQLQVSRCYVSGIIRRTSREGLYCAEGEPIGWDQNDIIERDRAREAVLRELELLRAHASRPAYG